MEMETQSLYRVLLIPENLRTSDEKLNVLKLKHPRTNTPICCIESPDGALFELSKFSEKYSSWFIGDTVIEDGSMQILTPVDPLFLILPYLNKDNKFCPLEDVLVDETYPDSKCLCNMLTPEELANICKSKDAVGLTVYCYDDNETLNWLRKKVEHISKALIEKKVSITDGAEAQNYKPAMAESANTEDLNRIGCRLISEYLDEAIAAKLFSSFGLPFDIEENGFENGVTQPQKKEKLSGDVCPSDDYSNSTPVAETKNACKLTASQKRLQKGDKSGMKSISSFFQKK